MANGRGAQSDGRGTQPESFVVTLGFAAEAPGRGVAYAAFGDSGEAQVVRVPFELTLRPALRGLDVAYAALNAVAEDLFRRGLRDVEFRLEDERVAVDLAERRSVPAPLTVPYVALRCRLNRFARAGVIARRSRTSRDLTNRARAEASLQIAA